MVSVRNKILVLVLCFTFFLAGCGKPEHIELSKESDDDFVTASIQLVWENKQDNLFRSRLRTLAVDPNSLKHVVVTVYDENDDQLVKKQFEYKKHQGTVRVKAGPRRTFVAEGKLPSGYIVFRGENTKDLNRGSSPTTVTVTMRQDSEPPQNPKISGPPATMSRLVTLSISSTDNCGITGYFISEISESDPRLQDPNWPYLSSPDIEWQKIDPNCQTEKKDKKNYQKDIDFTLSEGIGTKTICLCFRDGAENKSVIFSYSIEYESSDMPGITVNPTTGLITTEAGGTASFSIVLDMQPEAEVTIKIKSNNETEGNVDANSADPNNYIIFTPDNWNIARNVTIIGVNDEAADGDTEYQINIEAAISADPKYNGLLPDPNFISLINWDNEGSFFEPDANTIALWHLNIDGVDASGNGNDLEVKEDRVSWVNGKHGKAVEMGTNPWSGDCFNSDGGALTAPGSDCSYPGNGDWTVEAWIQFPSISKDYEIVYHYSKDLEGHEPYFIGISNGIAKFQIQDSNNSLDVVSADISNHINQWIHIAGVYRYGKNADKFQKNGLELYVNDTFASAVDTILIPETLPDYDVFLGGSYCGICTGLKIDEVRISNIARYGDTDSDGMPDYWESRYNLDLNDPNDAAEDPDEDHLYNFEEYTYRTDPTNSDTDGDGFKDGAELIAGCYPGDPNDPVRQIYYVDIDATGENDGSSWVDAYNSLQDALFARDFGDVIWVSEGIYKPDQSIHITQGNREASFQLKNGVSLYGGFSGIETSRDQRDWLLHRTILSGDLNGDDGPNFTNNEDNSYHVVGGSGTNESAIIDGFIITAGNANGSPYYDRGGGMYIEVGNPRIINCMFKGNFANLGSGIHCYRGSSPIITNCIFTSNLADLGGGIACSDYAKPIFADCTITDNHANSYGGGMACQGYPSRPAFTNCIFWGNSPDEIACGGSNDPNISYSDIQGGYIGGTGNIDADPLFINPNAQDYHLQHGSPCIDAGDPNSAALNFPEKDIDNESRPFGDRYDMGADEFYDTDNDGMPDYWEIKYNLVQGDPNNKDEDPDLDGLSNLEEYKNGTNPVNLDTDGDGCIDKVEIDHGTDPLDQESYPTILYVNTSATGDNNGANWNDAFKNLQDALTVANLNENFQEIWVAQGTYQPDQGNGIEPGDRTASFHLKNGVAVYGGFAGGEENIEQRDWELHQTILSGDLNEDDDPNFLNYEENSYHVVTGNGTDETAIIDGFIIEAGNADGTVSQINKYGGGLYNNSGSLNIMNCIFRDNWAHEGGGIYTANGNLIITNCTFLRNRAGFGKGGGVCTISGSTTLDNCSFNDNRANNGGGVYNSNGSPTIIECSFVENKADPGTGGGLFDTRSTNLTITNCTFSYNFAATSGGGIYLHEQSTTHPGKMTNCTISSNTAMKSGGGIVFDGIGSYSLINCIISENEADDGGAIIAVTYFETLFINCTIVDNKANLYGGVIVCGGYQPNPNFVNCIFWGNSPDEIHCGYATITYSNIKGGYPGAGNIDFDPLFINGYHLKAGSPCIDKGTNYIEGLPEEDKDGIPRPQDGDEESGAKYDMGGYEFCDSDGDGMPDYWEMIYNLDFNDPNDSNKDIDDDYLLNLEEYIYQTNPVNPDTDGDGISDGEEVVTGEDGYITDPTKLDTDNDGFSDSKEIGIGKDPNCPETTPPVVTIKSPKDGDLVQENQTISIVVEVSDNYILSTVELYCDGNILETRDSGFLFDYQVPQGLNQIVVEASATDIAGNMAEDIITLNVSASSITSTVATGLKNISGIAVDSCGTIYAATSWDGLYKIVDGINTQIASGFGRFLALYDADFVNNELWVVYQHAIQKVTTSGNKGNTFAVASCPTGLARDPQNGDMYSVSAGDCGPKIVKTTTAGIATTLSTDGYGWVVDLNFGPNRKLYAIAGNPGTEIWEIKLDGSHTIFKSDSRFTSLRDMTMDSSGNMYVTNSSDGIIYKINFSDKTVSVFFSGLTNPRMITISPSGDFYVSTGTTITKITFSI